LTTLGPGRCRPGTRQAPAPAPARLQRAGGPPVSGASVLRLHLQELQPGLVDAVAMVRRGKRVAFIALRLEAVPGRWELIELLY
jgi:hypothetical protein